MPVISVNKKHIAIAKEALNQAGIPNAEGVQWVPAPEEIERLRESEAATIVLTRYSEGSALIQKWAKGTLGDPSGVTLQNGESIRRWDIMQTFPFLFIIIPTPVQISNVDGSLEFKRFGFRSTYRRQLKKD